MIERAFGDSRHLKNLFYAGGHVSVGLDMLESNLNQALARVLHRVK
jgi:hypothetical protein